MKQINEDAVKYIQTALSLSQDCSPHEKALIESLTTRYSKDTLLSRTELDSIYANEMRLVSQRFREDMDIATLFVESLMNLMPWDYWLKDGKPKLATREALAVLDYIEQKEPNHPGANHYRIHVVEEIYPELGTLSADRLAASQLSAGHLIHMPAHIYIQTGRYNDASIANEKAILADEKYLAKCEEQEIYPTVYYPHNIHFLSFSASMEGRSKVAIDAAKKLAKKTSEKMLSKFRSVEQYIPMPYLSLVRFKKWDDILVESKPKNSLLYTTLIWHYARGMAYANNGQLKKADIELHNIEQIKRYEAFKKLHSPGWPTLSIAEMTISVLKSEIAGAKGDLSTKIKFLSEAVAIQDQIVFVETPHFYYPIRQSLGYALLQNNQPLKAESVFNEDLDQFPNNGWSLHGLYQSLSEQQRAEEAMQIKANYDKAWVNADIEL